MTGLLRALAGHPPAKFCVLANALRDTRRGKAKTRNRRASLLLKIPVMESGAREQGFERADLLGPVRFHLFGGVGALDLVVLHRHLRF